MQSIISQTLFNMFKDSHVYYLNRMNNNEETISRLKFIGKIRKGDKINTLHMYVQPDGLSTSLSRTFFHKDNRGNTLAFCQDTIYRAFELIKLYEKSIDKSEKFLLSNILCDLKNSLVGLSNLKSTYVSDTKFCCDMDTIIQNVNAKMEGYQKYLLLTDKDNIRSIVIPSEKTNSDKIIPYCGIIQSI